MPRTKSRIVLAAMVLLAVAAVCPTSRKPAVAEMLLTTGTFDGVYHQDRWGVGHFGWFIVRPGLHARLARYEGKRIRLTVTKGEQPVSPGPAIMHEIGEVAVLGDPPLAIRLSTIPAKPAPGVPLQVMVRLENTTQAPLGISRDVTVISVNAVPKVDRPEQPVWLMKDYTRGQMATPVQRVQLVAPVTLPDRAPTNLAPLGNLTLPAGDSFPFVALLPDGLPEGKYEIEASTHVLPDPKTVECLTWLRFDVAGANRNERDEPPPLRVLERSVRAAADGYRASAAVAPPAGEQRRIAVNADHTGLAYAGRIQAVAEDGTGIDVQADYPNWQGEWRLDAVPEDGFRIEIPFGRASHFDGNAIARVTLDLLTDRGVQTFLLAEDFADPLACPAVPFGPPIDGVKLRIRPAKAAFSWREQPVFYLQFVNVSGQPVMWPHRTDEPYKYVTVEIDGRKTDSWRGAYVGGGWAVKRLCPIPHEGMIILPKDLRLSIGKHTLCYSIKCKGGTYRNTEDQPVPIVRGRIVSNETEFAVER